MKRKFVPWIGLIFLDLLFAGIGMGVPILNIFLGVLVGWVIVKKSNQAAQSGSLYRWIFSQALLTTGPMFLILAVIWGSTVVLLFDPTTDFANFGHPFILFDPRLSFIGWLVLMIFISPVLRLLTTVFASFLTLFVQERAQKDSI